MQITFEEMKSRGLLRDIDAQFTQAIARICDEDQPLVHLGIALASAQIAEGHICADLNKICEKPLKIALPEDKELEFQWPELDTWVKALKSSAAVGTTAGNHPLYLDEANRLFVTRHYEAQDALVKTIKRRLELASKPIDEALLKNGLERLFELQNEENEDYVPWQALAAIGAVRRNFSVVSGGPGTGKTTTVIKMLALLFEQVRAEKKPYPRVALLAPTGKAASRLEESIRDKIAGLECDEEIKEALPKNASTIHRGLKSTNIPGKNFEHDRDNPLAVDVVIVDEASMIPLGLMAQLFEATPRNSKLILLGDEHQLASVQAGAILGDICNAKHRGEHSMAFIDDAINLTGTKLKGGTEEAPAIRDAIVELKDSHRFDDTKGIGKLARAIKDGQASKVLELLKDQTTSNVSLIGDGKTINEEVQALICENYETYIKATDPSEKLNRFNQFRVLCAHRRGELGAEKINQAIARLLGKTFSLRAKDQWYPNLPVMVTQNDYRQSLYNGDIGIIGADDDVAGRLVTRFPSSEGNGELRVFTPSRLPQHEPVYAMTIHKSQGSEFNTVLVVLPAELSPILSRELLYTAVTRASARVFILAKEDVITQAVQQEISRASGLTDALWKE